MSNSSLVNCTIKSPNHSGVRTHTIDRITPHCVVGQLTAASIGGCFTSPDKQASCNYGIGSDGKICLVVDECNRSWCSSNNANDQRAVTIECASDSIEPYAFTDTVYNKLIELCIDICKRNGKTKLIWFADKDTALNYNPASDEMVLTVHRWFANKSCPGDWMYAHMTDLAEKVTAQLNSNNTDNAESVMSTQEMQTSTVNNASLSTGFVSYTVKVLANLNIRKGPGTNYGTNGVIRDKGVYTIVAESDGQGASKWGKLKSGVGWISLDYCSKV